jgi:catechol 2,3-dioxygenase-like lactoylglutathione lyase family enzyme
MTDLMRFEGLTLTVESVERSLAFYEGKLGLKAEWRSLPAFAMLRIGHGTIGLLSMEEAQKDVVAPASAAQRAATHVEFTTDDLDGLHAALVARGVVFHAPPHDEPWERAMTALDPDGYAVEFAQGKRGKNQIDPARSGAASDGKPEQHQFMFLFRGGAASMPDMTAEARQAQIARWGVWTSELRDRGSLVPGGAPLGADRRMVGARGAPSPNGDTVTGNLIVRAASLDEAESLAKGCPILGVGGSVEVCALLDRAR